MHLRESEMDQAIALVDCNNFFVSCERIFNPKLKGRPVVVLSNNDGCVISRSQEAKALGIPMGAPAFKYEHIFNAYKVAVFSSNFTLYGDISGRIMEVLGTFVPDPLIQQEIYSIDESFLTLDFIKPENRRDYGLKITKEVLRITGVPVSIGIAPTKTLAKIANGMAKKNNSGAISFYDFNDPDPILKEIEVEDIWGIGRRLGLRLRVDGVYTAYDLKYANDSWIRKKLSVTGLRTAMELRGTPCAEVSQREIHKSIRASRSFGRPVTTLPELEEAISFHATRVGEKLRREGLKAKNVFAYIRTSRFKSTPFSNELGYGASEGFSFITPTNDTPTLIRVAIDLLRNIFRPGYDYTKAGVSVFNLTSDSVLQLPLFTELDQDETDHNQTPSPLMRAIDSVNITDGRDTLFFAAAGIDRKWRGKSQKTSQRFTTRWDELLTIRV